MNEAPLISVILVVLNNKDFIGQAIDNFLEQQCPEAELVVVDGASTDGTKEIIWEYAAKHQNISALSEKDSGQSDAMNKGINRARGTYISFLNVDDFYHPNALNQAVAAIKSHNFPNFLVANCHVWAADGSLVFHNRPSNPSPHAIISGETLLVNPSAYVYKKELHEKVGLYAQDNHYNMDLEFVYSAALICPFIYINQDWGNFRMLPNTKTSEDMEAGRLEKRKKDLAKRILTKAPAHIRLKVYAIWTLKALKKKKFAFAKKGKGYAQALAYKFGIK